MHFAVERKKNLQSSNAQAPLELKVVYLKGFALRTLSDPPTWPWPKRILPLLVITTKSILTLLHLDRGYSVARCPLPVFLFPPSVRCSRSPCEEVHLVLACSTCSCNVLDLFSSFPSLVRWRLTSDHLSSCRNPPLKSDSKRAAATSSSLNRL